MDRAGRGEQKAKALELLREHGVMRLRDLGAAGVQAAVVTRLVQKGDIAVVSRGVYALPGIARDLEGEPDTAKLMAVTKSSSDRVEPVVVMLSAAAHHKLISREPTEVWLAFPPDTRRTRASDSTVRIKALCWGWEKITEGREFGIERVRLESGGAAREALITNPARTIADLIRLRHLIGKEYVVEAVQTAARRPDLVRPDNIREVATEVYGKRWWDLKAAPYVAAAYPLNW